MQQNSDCNFTGCSAGTRKFCTDVPPPTAPSSMLRLSVFSGNCQANATIAVIDALPGTCVPVGDKSVRLYCVSGNCCAGPNSLSLFYSATCDGSFVSYFYRGFNACFISFCKSVLGVPVNATIATNQCSQNPFQLGQQLMFTCSSAPAITLPALSSVPQVVAFDLYNDNACTISDWPVTSGNEGSCIPAIGPYHSARVFCQGQSVLYLDTACSLPYPYVFSPRNTSSNGACQLNGINGYMAIICSSSSPVTLQPTVVFLILCVVVFYSLLY